MVIHFRDKVRLTASLVLSFPVLSVASKNTSSPENYRYCIKKRMEMVGNRHEISREKLYRKNGPHTLGISSRPSKETVHEELNTNRNDQKHASEISPFSRFFPRRLLPSRVQSLTEPFPGPYGQRVKTLIGDLQESGSHTLTWNGRDDRGRPVASGMYLCRIESGTQVAVRKMMLM
jgi:hypothetical protein